MSSDVSSSYCAGLSIFVLLCGGEQLMKTTDLLDCTKGSPNVICAASWALNSRCVKIVFPNENSFSEIS